MACTPGGDPLDLGELPPHYLLAAAGWTKAPAELIDVDENKSAGRQCLMGYERSGGQSVACLSCTVKRGAVAAVPDGVAGGAPCFSSPYSFVISDYSINKNTRLRGCFCLWCGERSPARAKQ